MMIPLSDAALDVLMGPVIRLKLAVDSWYNGQLLATDIPVDSATEEVDRSQNVPERVTLTVPRRDPKTGMNWTPVGDDHPLAANGQQLKVQLGIDLGNNVVEWFQRGWYLITDSEADGDTVSVTASGLLALIQEARLITPYQPTGNISDVIRGLTEPALSIVVDSSLTDRSVPSGINYSDDRLGDVYSVLDAWPAVAVVDPYGFLEVTSATVDPTPVLSLTDGKGGTIIRATGKSSRDGAYNIVVAQGTASDGGQVQGVCQIISGPTAYGGPFSPLPVPYFFSSPLLTTNAQCAGAAQTIAARKQREKAIGFDVEMVPHYALQTGDVVSVTTDDYTDLLCTVEYLSLPWKAKGGSQKLTVRSLS